MSTSTFHRMAASQQPGMGKAVVGKSQAEQDKENKTGVKITAAIFFDGTGNNLNNTTQRLLTQRKLSVAGLTNTGSYQRYGHDEDEGASYQNFYSNVALLSLMNTKREPTKREVSVYIEGIGTEDNLADDELGQGFGAGSTGLKAKVDREKKLGALTDGGIARLVTGIKPLYKPKIEYIEQLTLHVYGFSRGAAAARYFIARKAALCRKLGIEPKVVVYEFVGLFDTVSSYESDGTGAFGTLGYAVDHNFNNDVGELGLALHAGRDQIKKVVHLVAANEYRLNFASTNINSAIRAGVGYELVLPGAHSDIGGGYGEAERETRRLAHEGHLRELVAAGWYDEGRHVRVTKELVTDYHDSLQPRYRTLYTGVRTLSNQFQYIPLAAMMELAAWYGPAFSEARLYAGVSLAVPADLASVKADLVAYALTNDGAHRKEFRFRSVAQTHHVRQHYLHRSDSVYVYADGRTGMNARLVNGWPTRQPIDG